MANAMRELLLELEQYNLSCSEQSKFAILSGVASAFIEGKVSEYWLMRVGATLGFDKQWIDIACKETLAKTRGERNFIN